MDFQDVQTLAIGLSVLVAVIGFVIVIAIRSFAPHLTDQIPASVATQLLEFTKSALQAGLARAAETEETWDEDFYLAGLRLLGFKITGNKEIGWTIVPPEDN